MRLLYRFYDLTPGKHDEAPGQILIDDQDIAQMRTCDLRSHIAIVPQDCVLFNDTALYNISYGGVGLVDHGSEKNNLKITAVSPDNQGQNIFSSSDKDPNPNELTALLKLKSQPALSEEQHEEADKLITEQIIPFAKDAQIHDFLSSQKKGYLEKVGERGLKLSGGEKQRVAIARALIKRSQIMCFDEATSSLDNETESQVQSAIDQICQGEHAPTTLIIAHRLTTVQNCDKIIVLRDGEIVETGTHDELTAPREDGSKGYYKRLWDFQAMGVGLKEIKEDKKKTRR